MSGAAALLHHIFTVKNGLLDYHDEVGEAYGKAFIKNVSADVNAELAKQAKRDRFKIVS